MVRPMIKHLVASPVPREKWHSVLANDPGALPEHAPEWIDAMEADGRYRDASRLYSFADGREVLLPSGRSAAALPASADGSSPTRRDGAWEGSSGTTSTPTWPARCCTTCAAWAASACPSARIRNAGTPGPKPLTGTSSRSRAARTSSTWPAGPREPGTACPSRPAAASGPRNGKGCASKRATPAPCWGSTTRCSSRPWTAGPRTSTNRGRWPTRGPGGATRWASCSRWAATWGRTSPSRSPMSMAGRRPGPSRFSPQPPTTPGRPWTRNWSGRPVPGNWSSGRPSKWPAKGAAPSTTWASPASRLALARFKEKFGAVPHDYAELRLDRLPWTRTDATLRRAAKRVLGFRDV